MPRFRIEADCRSALVRLFEADALGHVNFGWSGHSLQPASHNDLLAGAIRFRDYIMEGFLIYSVQAEDLSPGCLLRFDGEGSNRDWSIGLKARQFIQSSGLIIIQEADD